MLLTCGNAGKLGQLAGLADPWGHRSGALFRDTALISLTPLAQRGESRADALWRHEHVACLAARGRADDPGGLQDVHDLAGRREPDAHLALEHRRGGELSGDHEFGSGTK